MGAVESTLMETPQPLPDENKARTGAVDPSHRAPSRRIADVRSTTNSSHSTTSASASAPSKSRQSALKISTASTPTNANTQTKATTPSSPQPKIKILKGSVCGHTNTGKSSLLQRLRGEEDSVIVQKKTKRRMMALIPWSPFYTEMDMTTMMSSNHGVSSAVQLHVVERYEKSYAELKKKSDVDFIVFMVDRTNRESLDFAISFLNGLAEHCISKGEGNGKDDGQEGLGHEMRMIPCVCILLNYYDVKAAKEENNGTSSVEGTDSDSNGESLLLSLDDVKEIIRTKVLGNITEQTSSPISRMQIKCLDACMMNGYGLEALNSFISLPYFQKKERDLAAELELVRGGLKSWDERFDKILFSSYDEFCEEFESSSEEESEEEEEDEEEEEEEEVTVEQQQQEELEEGGTSSGSDDEVIVKKVQQKNNDRDIKSQSRPPSTASDDRSAAESQKEGLESKTKDQQRDVTRRRIITPAARDEDGQESRTSSKSSTKIKKAKKKKKKKSSSSRKRKEKQGRDMDYGMRHESAPKPRHCAKPGKVQAKKPCKPPLNPTLALEAFLASDDESDGDAAGTSVQDAGVYSNSYIINSNYGNLRNSAVLYSDDSDASSAEDNVRSSFGQYRAKKFEKVEPPKIENVAKAQAHSNSSESDTHDNLHEEDAHNRGNEVNAKEIVHNKAGSESEVSPSLSKADPQDPKDTPSKDPTTPSQLQEYSESSQDDRQHETVGSEEGLTEANRQHDDLGPTDTSTTHKAHPTSTREDRAVVTAKMESERKEEVIVKIQPDKEEDANCHSEDEESVTEIDTEDLEAVSEVAKNTFPDIVEDSSASGKNAEDESNDSVDEDMKHDNDETNQIDNTRGDMSADCEKVDDNNVSISVTEYDDCKIQTDNINTDTPKGKNSSENEDNEKDVSSHGHSDDASLDQDAQGSTKNEGKRILHDDKIDGVGELESSIDIQIKKKSSQGSDYDGDEIDRRNHDKIHDDQDDNVGSPHRSKENSDTEEAINKSHNGTIVDHNVQNVPIGDKRSDADEDVVHGSNHNHSTTDIHIDSNTGNRTFSERDSESDEKQPDGTSQEKNETRAAYPVSKAQKSSRSLQHTENESDDECFMVAEDGSRTFSQSSYRKPISRIKNATPSQDEKEAVSNPVVSEAIRKAIAAAQEEAERMLNPEPEPEPEPEHLIPKSKKKSSKKMKNKKGDKKKKKKKYTSETSSVYNI